jgi:hypothetical protein
MTRLFYWFAGKAKSQGTFFSQKGAELQSTKDTERQMREMFSGQAEQVTVNVVPNGDSGPEMLAILADKWMVTRIGRLSGEYTVIGQVEQVVKAGDEWPVLRLTQDAPVTPRELETMKAVVAAYPEAAKGLGIQLSGDEATLTGPGLVITPIAIFR